MRFSYFLSHYCDGAGKITKCTIYLVIFYKSWENGVGFFKKFFWWNSVILGFETKKKLDDIPLVFFILSLISDFNGISLKNSMQNNLKTIIYYWKLNIFIQTCRLHMIFMKLKKCFESVETTNIKRNVSTWERIQKITHRITDRITFSH